MPAPLPFRAVRRYFGTDGVRGVVGEDLTRGARRAPRPCVRALERRRVRARRPGHPPLGPGRSSAALAAGLASGGLRRRRWPASCRLPPSPCSPRTNGAVVSASHNPAEYNGVKFFAPRTKLTDERGGGDRGASRRARAAPSAERSGASSGLADRYVGPRVRALRAVARAVCAIAVDCANGALSEIAPAGIRASRCGRHCDRGATPTARTSTTAAGRPTSRSSPRRPRGTVPTSASPSTATATGCSRSTPQGRRWTATRSSPCWRCTSGVDLVAVTHDDEPRLPPADGGARHPGGHDRRRRPLRARGPPPGRRSPRRRAVRPRDRTSTAT